MSISTPRLFPQVQGWAHGNLWVASHGTFGPQDELDLFDANLDADALVRLAGTLRENAIITLKGLLNYDGQIDPELIIGLVDDENPNPPGTYFVEGRILHFFACLSIILPETVIRIHGVFKTLTSLGSIFPGWPQHPAVHMGDEQPEDVLCTMIRYFYRWGQAIRVYFKMWRDDSRDAVEIRKAVNLLRTRAGKAHAIWLPVRNSLVEFQDIHKFRYVDTLIRKFDMAFWTLDWELQLSENLARRLEEEAARPSVDIADSSFNITTMQRNQANQEPKRNRWNWRMPRRVPRRNAQGRDQWLVRSAVISMLVLSWRRGHRKYDIMDDDKKIKTKNPLLFHSLIVLSCVTLVASAVVYPYHPLSSIPVAWAAGIAQNIATLLIIQDTGNRIMEDLEHRLANQG